MSRTKVTQGTHIVSSSPHARTVNWSIAINRAIAVAPGLLEQGFTSSLSFVSLALMGRLLEPDDFAVYILLFAAVSFPFQITTSFWVYPAMYFLPRQGGEGVRQYIRSVTLLNGVTTVVLTGAALWAYHLLYAKISLGLGLAAALAAVGWRAPTTAGEGSSTRRGWVGSSWLRVSSSARVTS